jgi:U3 small nucleolar RNA-associated protein 10
MRLLQIVSLPPKFAFLGQYTNARTAETLPPVPRQLFIRAISRDSVFLESYCQYIVSRVKNNFGFPAMITTWVTLLVESINQMRQSRVNDEMIVSRIMPFIAQGLQMKQSTDLQIACYMALTVLASKGTLTETVLNAAMDAIVQGCTDKSRKTAIMCLVTLAQSRDAEKASTSAVIKALMSIQYRIISYVLII